MRIHQRTCEVGRTRWVLSAWFSLEVELYRFAVTCLWSGRGASLLWRYGLHTVIYKISFTSSYMYSSGRVGKMLLVKRATCMCLFEGMRLSSPPSWGCWRSIRICITVSSIGGHVLEGQGGRVGSAWGESSSHMPRGEQLFTSRGGGAGIKYKKFWSP